MRSAGDRAALMDALASEADELKLVLRRPPQTTLTSDGGRRDLHWFVSEDAVDIKHLDPAGPMDETTFRWIMNEDAMATEKLSEGIRVLANDLKTLRRRTAERLLRFVTSPRRQRTQSRDDRGAPPEQLEVSKRPMAA